MKIDAEHFRVRLLQDLLTEATSGYWLRRAEDFERVGTGECGLIALACRRHASLVRWQTDIEPEVIRAVREAA